MKYKRLIATSLLALLLFALIPEAQLRTILLLRHVEQPETESNQYQFTAPDDIDVVGYLRSLCYRHFFESLEGGQLLPKAIVVQYPKHSRRGIESVVPLAYSLRLPIRICCRKFDIKGLVGFIGALEEDADPVLIVWWGRMMPAIARALGVKRKDVPHWPNHWNGSSVLWIITTPPTTTRTEFRTVHMNDCDPEAERERYCFRSIWQPGIPRPDGFKRQRGGGH